MYLHAQVGLLSVDLSSLPPAWDLSPDELPGLGASPDALIRHHLPIPWAAIEDARARIAVRQGVPVGLGQSQSAQGGGTSHVSSGSGNTGAPIPAVVLPGGPPSPPEVRHSHHCSTQAALGFTCIGKPQCLGSSSLLIRRLAITLTQSPEGSFTCSCTCFTLQVSVQAAAVLEAVCLLHGALANLLTSPPGEQGELELTGMACDTWPKALYHTLLTCLHHCPHLESKVAAEVSLAAQA
jgi:hypothetical protein